MDWLLLLLTVAAGYLIGSIPFGYLVARARGVDIIRQGSGNIGATNVGRVLGWRFGAVVFVLDFAKGVVPVLGTRALDTAWPAGSLEVAAGLAAFLGHLFPIWLGFKGGKGVATGVGVALMLVPGPALAALAVWVLAVLATRYVSVASILAVVALATVQFMLAPVWTNPRTLFCLFAGALVVVKHRSNLARLREGRENQIREGPSMMQLTKSLHVLALAVWFGSAVFFSFVAGFSLFGSFEQRAETDPLPAWFQRAPWFNHKDDAIDGPHEQGALAAGFAIGPMFTIYFALQIACGVVALATAFAWGRRGGVHHWRVSLLLTALLLACAGWPLEQFVHQLREPRNTATERYLLDHSEENRRAMQAARGEFGKWHRVSVLLNLAGIVCVFGATAVAANLPTEPAKVSTPEKELSPA